MSRATDLTRRIVLGGGAVGGVAAATGLAYLGTRPGGGLVNPGRSRARAIKSSASLPRAADAVVIGGGIVGTMTALVLAERGLKVVLCEKGVIAGEASGRSLGYVDGLFLDPVKMPLVARSKALWAGLSERVGAQTGYRRSGLMGRFASDAGVEAARAWVAAVTGLPGVDARVLSAAQAGALYQGGAGPLAGALYQASDGVAEPELAAPAIAERVMQLGGTVMQACAVRGIETAGGKVVGVVTEHGPITTPLAILAGGVWSPLMARSLGIDLPQFMAFGSVLRLAPTAGPSLSLIDTDHTFVTRRNHLGGYDLCIGTGTAPITPDLLRNLYRLGPAVRNMWDSVNPALNWGTLAHFARMPAHWGMDDVSPFERDRVFMPEPRPDQVARLLKEAPGVFPFMRASRPVESWSGSLMSTPDNMPVLSGVAGHAGLLVGAGFYYGLTMGPAAGEALADLATGRKPQFDLAPYRLERFSNGEALTFRA
jgi:glycine/D-amino acid oxidase-like deaminating enzyme